MAGAKKKQVNQPVTKAAEAKELFVKGSELPSNPVIGFVNSCWVFERDGFCEFTFSYVSLDKDVTGRYSIVIPVVSLENQLWPTTETFYTEVSNWLSDRQADIMPVNKGDYGNISERSVVTLVSVSRLDYLAEINGFFVTPSSIVAAQRGVGKPKVLPVCSVQMPTALLIGILKYIKEEVID